MINADSELPGVKYVSPSRLARYYYHECDRFLRYTSTAKADRGREGVPDPPYDTSPVTHAILEGGYIWEEEVVRRLGDLAHVAAASRPGVAVRDRIHDAEASRSALLDLRPGRYVYQPTLRAPARFYRRYGLDMSRILMTAARPDLVECYEDADGAWRLRVLDVKASSGLKLSHRIQATLYTLVLREALEEWGVTDRRVADDAGIWLASADGPERFDIRSMLPPLEQFLETRLQPILAGPAAAADWHLYFRCEWCPYFDHCRDEMRREDTVSRMPYLSVHAKQYLGSLTPGIRTVPEFASMLADESRVGLLDVSASLRGREPELASQARALQTGEIVVHRGASIEMPRGENVRIVVTLQSEPVTGLVYAYAIHAQGLKDVLGQNPAALAGVAPDQDPATIEAVERDIVRSLHALLSAVDRYNAARDGEWGAQKSLQTYVFDTYESAHLTEVLTRRLADPLVAEQALDLFCHFQQPELVKADDHPAAEAYFPVVVLTSVLRRLFALPVEVSYRFADAVRLLPPSGHPFTYRDSDYWGFALSNQLRSDAIFAVWHRGKAEYRERIARELRQRVWAANSLVDGMRERLDHETGSLFAWPPKFRFPDRLGFRSTTLSRLAFISRYESVLRYLEVREARTAPRLRQLREATLHELESIGAGAYRLARDPSVVDLRPSPYASWLLARDDADGWRALLAFNDYAYRARPWTPKQVPIAFAALTDAQPDGQGMRLTVALTRSPAFGDEPRPGERFLLVERFTDPNVDRAIAELRDIDNQADAPFVRLLEGPSTWSKVPPHGPTTREIALELGRRHGMTPSQIVAFERVIDRTVHMVWGPPGTGKTHFLALAILCLAEAHRQRGLPLAVYVTAFTHAAIENCLRKLAEFQTNFGVVRDEIAIGKLRSMQRPLPSNVELVGHGTAAAWISAHPLAVLGGTVWATLKGFPPASVDLVVIDEGSQVRVPEAAIAVRRLREGGRLVIAGDHLQLPPILQAAYPEPGPGEPLLHRSIFEALSRDDESPDGTSMLLENFRMNATLCRYPAEQIYRPEYRSANAQIASRRLRLTAEPATSGLVHAMVDPDYPLVVGVLDGVRATSENRVEAALVADIVIDLRRRLRARDGRAYPETREGEQAFWTDGLFVVSPHHAQIAAITRALSARRDWLAPPFVDTVDKMQGQECDAVITSYGVSDVEYAMGERDFIYSLNRLNVATTRARAKSIVFLPRPLIEPPIAAFEDERLADAIAFMQGLVRFAEHRGVSDRVALDEGELTLLRVPALPYD